MEVHAHSHTERKKFKHYLWEFLMLFLAVFCGFMAENLREHKVEHQRERQYMIAISEDINTDIHYLDSIIAARKNMDAMMDSLLHFLNGPDPQQHGNDIYYYARWMPRTFVFFSDDRTFVQLKNAGNWRLIRNQKVSDQLASYDNLVRTITQFIDHREESLVLILYQSIDKIFDNEEFEQMVSGLGFNRPVNNPRLISYDKNELNELCNRIHFRKNANYYYMAAAERLMAAARKTIETIRLEYHLGS
jgi:hypothetical protein